MGNRVNLAFLLCLLLISGVMFAQEKNTFTWRVGQFEVNLLAESQGEGNQNILIGATPDMMKEWAPEGKFPNAMNAFLVKTPDKVILVDAGLGNKLFENMRSLGVEADQVDIIILTHMHGDHIGGLIKDGKVMFPKAEIYLPQPEYDYWMSDSKFERQQNVIRLYKDRLHLFMPGKLGQQASDLIPGFKAYAAYGHTPGHTIYMLESANDRMLIWGDLTHAMALQMPYPQVAVTYDVNPGDAIESRKQVLKYVSENNIPIAGMHIAYPAMGKISVNNKGGYIFHPMQ